MGGPVWHASGKSTTVHKAEQIALRGLDDVGSHVGQRIFVGNGGIVHVQRLLTKGELFAIAKMGLQLQDISGTDEEARRIAIVLAEAPLLAALMPPLAIPPRP